MPINRVFLGHSQPALPLAAEYLLNRYGSGNRIDCREVVVVVPGSLAGRRLLEILVDLSARRHLILTPPAIETVGKLPEQLYRPKRPFATELTQRVVWAETLKQAPRELLLQLISDPPQGDDLNRWLPLADLLRRQHTELAADGLSFADVARLGQKIDNFQEQQRWKTLQSLQEDYLRRLDALELWDVQTARLKAIEFKESRTSCDIIVIGAVDLNVTMRKMLDQVQDRVTALIFGPPEWRDRFDHHGCLIPTAWEKLDLSVDSDQVSLAERPSDQAEIVAAIVAGYQGRFRADEIVIGVPDEQLVPHLEQRLAIAGGTARWGPGQSFDQTAPVKLLAAIAAYLEEQRYSQFAAMIRHPDVEQWLIRRRTSTDALETLDGFQNHQFPFRIELASATSAAESESIAKITDEMKALLGELLEPSRPLAEWQGPLWRVLIEVYGHRPLDVAQTVDSMVLTVCTGIRQGLQEIALMPPAVMPRVSASRAIGFLLDELRNKLVPAPITPDSIEMLGWLELPLDDAPALIVTNFNEGFVPESLNSDLFLPDAMRRQLGLLDNARRYARDAYAVSVIVATRPSAHWIVAKRNHDGDPLAPSRLLFACDAETAAKRALQLFGPAQHRIGDKQQRSKGQLAIPRPRPLDRPIERLNVTAFRDYIACPYRFYLKHVLRLETVSDDLGELDGGAFGSLAHEIFRRFGTGDARESKDPDQILEVLERDLEACSAEMFGSHPLPAVLVQVEQLRWRLRAFAKHQAAWCQQGWRIEFIESPAKREEAAVLSVDGQPIRISGRIDRIDRHVETGERMILDYKTSDAGMLPDQVHRRGEHWIDLQLPLYRHMAATLGVSGPLRLGYILLPKDTSATQFVEASWTAEDLAKADDIAWEVVRRIRRQEFWPPADPPPDFSEDFAPICQDGVV